MERARRGSRFRFLYFWRVLVWLNLTYSPSQPNHTGLFWGSPCGPKVATWARALLRSRSTWLSGTRVLFSVVTRSPCRGFRPGLAAGVMVSDLDEPIGTSGGSRTALT